ncbi:MAG: hypothetical protein UT50_C0032G0005 [Candidatus Moranbacteria bacterium GW2011_GWA2_39_41]|nr:MAG: hypothetical protein UT50_C0032G0005 [Candidatus Moranbacteria bacterium GW2011_GWA2_39_41]
MTEEKKETEKTTAAATNQLEAMLDEYMVKKAPFAMPAEVKEFIVKVSPYLIIIFAVMGLPVILAAIGLNAVLTPFAMMGGYGYGYGYGWGFGAIISLAVAVITIVMEVMAVPGLFKRTKGSWKLLFYASIVSLIGGILAVHGIVGTIIGAIIGWYILFQVKDMYKN